jgi:shikimate 5-dehydrogenase
LPDRAIAYDLIYIPSPTRFLPLAAAQGLQTFDGVEMLVQQGAAGLEIWAWIQQKSFAKILHGVQVTVLLNRFDEIFNPYTAIRKSFQ